MMSSNIEGPILGEHMYMYMYIYIHMYMYVYMGGYGLATTIPPPNGLTRQWVHANGATLRLSPIISEDFRDYYESPWLGSTCASYYCVSLILLRFLGSAATYPSMLQEVDCWVYHWTRCLDTYESPWLGSTTHPGCCWKCIPGHIMDHFCMCWTIVQMHNDLVELDERLDQTWT